MAETTPPPATSSSRPAASHRLSEREIEILRLLAAGHSNQAIAQQLSISRATVARHIANIYDKLNVNSRATATGYAHRHGLI